VALLLRLFLLVAVALLPAIAIQSYNEFDLRRSRQSEAQEQALGLAKLAASEQQQIVEGIRQVLTALSELPAIKARDIEACNAYLSALKRRYPAFLSFVVVDMKGDNLCATNNDKKRNLADRPYFVSVMRTGEFSVGEYSIGRLTGRRVIQFAMPFYGDDARMGGIIVTALSLDWLAQYSARLGVPPGAALAIVDRNGTYLARYPDNDRFVGRKMPDDQDRREDHPRTGY
jgi:C4-dicarboxylate-specific signal transduction histidine kinase